MATHPQIPLPDTIEPQPPPEMPPSELPAEESVPNFPEILNEVERTALFNLQGGQDQMNGIEGLEELLLEELTLGGNIRIKASP